MLLWLYKMNVLLLLCSYAAIGLAAVSQDKTPAAPEEELSQLQATVKS